MTAAFTRDAALARLRCEPLDVLVVGAGITGAGVALDAAARGLKVGIVDRGDFASGTSSKSSKLVHGGLRYLQQKELRLVYENLAERQRLLDNAPHLVRPLPFLLPVFGRDGAVKRSVAKAYRTALWLYDLTGAVRIGHRHQRLTKDEALAHLPTLNPDLLVAAFLYWDARADDARLTLAVLRTAVLHHGAIAANHSPVVALRKEDGRVVGATLADGTEVTARCVVNAAGVWADEVRSLDEGHDPDELRPAKGIHITVPLAKLPCDIAAVLPVPKDRRSIFVIPWGEAAYLGTTDTDYEGPLDDPQCTAEDVRYLLDTVNLFITGEKLTAADVLGSWAGLRPLLKGAGNERTADLSRRHTASVSASGVVSVTGGKLTTYRRMAADAVDRVVGEIGKGARRSPTKRMRLIGATRQPVDLRALSEEQRGHLHDRYGSEARTIAAMIAADAELAQPLVPGLPYLKAEALFAVRYEMAHTLDDVLSRRTRALLLARDAAVAAAPDVARLIADELGWTAAEIDAQVGAFRDRAERERGSADLPPTLLGESGTGSAAAR
ncbi:MAG TPA: glycerol-3-phosphate dehydrogenase/oxidase [Acidimicrobiales bacterium]|nr:glycerol-3-phosphate dehydrogenase/oxidase [Acidimicrobiales bacterium]